MISKISQSLRIAREPAAWENSRHTNALTKAPRPWPKPILFFDPASGGRRWAPARTIGDLNATILAGATTAARRSGSYARINPWITSAVDSLVGKLLALVSSCNRPIPTMPSERTGCHWRTLEP